MVHHWWTDWKRSNAGVKDLYDSARESPRQVAETAIPSSCCGTTLTLSENDGPLEATSEEWSAHYDNTKPATIHFTQRECVHYLRKHGDMRALQVQREDIHIKQPARTTLADGRNSLLFDPGSRISLVGYNTAESFQEAAAAHQRQLFFRERPRLNVNGVGAGYIHCQRGDRIWR